MWFWLPAMKPENALLALGMCFSIKQAFGFDLGMLAIVLFFCGAVCAYLPMRPRFLETAIHAGRG